MRKMAPMGDPIELHLRGYELTIRAEDARKIEIVSDKTVSTKEPASRPPHAAGRGRRHGHREKNGIQANWQKDGHGLAGRGEMKMVFALIGNQNCGKTTLFNQLTGSNQHVGNFPGVTVEKKKA